MPLAATVFLITCATRSLAVATLQDSSFENSPGVEGQYADPKESAWTFVRSSGIARGSGLWGRGGHTGRQYAFIQRDGAVWQRVTGLMPGHVYRVNFSFARRTGSGDADYPNRITVRVNGLEMMQSLAPPNDESWHSQRSALFLARSDSAKLEFAGEYTAQDRSTLIDDVFVTDAGASRLQDGSFEESLVAGGSYSDGQGSPWTFLNHSGIAAGSSFWGRAGHSGRQYAFIQSGNTGSPGAIMQPVTGLVPGHRYVVQFYFARRTGFVGGDVPNPIYLRAGSREIMPFTAPPNDQRWHLKRSRPFTAMGSCLELEFAAGDSVSDQATLIDDVAIIDLGRRR